LVGGLLGLFGAEAPPAIIMCWWWFVGLLGAEAPPTIIISPSYDNN